MRTFLLNPRSTITTLTENASKTQKQQLISLNCQLANLNKTNQYQDALNLFDKIHSLHHHLKPDHYTLSTTLTACANLCNATFGNKLHAHAIKSGLKTNLHVGNTLLSLYAKARDVVSVKCVFGEIKNPDVYSYTTLLSACTKMGDVGYAFEVFDRLLPRDLAVWNAMITGCVESGNEEIGFCLFRDMFELCVKHDNYSFASVLSGCYFVDFGSQVHSLVIKTGFLATSSVVNSLMTMYFNTSKVVDAYSVFEEVGELVHDEITFNVMIDGLVSLKRAEEAFIIYREMLRVSIKPTELTFVSLMSSCLDTVVGYEVHAQAIKMKFEACTSVSNAAINMYYSFGDLHAAHMIFERLEKKDLVSWNTMISRFAQEKSGRSAILVYLDMQRNRIEPDEFTFGSLLASSDFEETVDMIHALVFKNNFDSNIQVSNALVSAYAKHGNIKVAYQIFCDMSSRNLISWNTLISGFLLNGLPMQGLEQLSKLLLSKFRPNEYTLSLLLSICASMSALRHGKQVHGYILKFGFPSKGFLGNTLVTMYAKCGLLDWSLRVFNAMTEKDVISWNALLSAYAQDGQGKEAVHCFEAMQNSSELKPDHTTFTAILSACSHAGLVDDGSRIFNSMVTKYGVIPRVDHFSCIVDLLGRSGYFDEVERIINTEHFEVHPNIWWTLVSACAAHGNLKLGRLAAGFLLEMEQDSPSVCVLLSNIYAAAGQWEEAANVRLMINNTTVMKQPGYSWIST